MICLRADDLMSLKEKTVCIVIEKCLIHKFVFILRYKNKRHSIVFVWLYEYFTEFMFIIVEFSLSGINDLKPSVSVARINNKVSAIGFCF